MKRLLVFLFVFAINYVEAGVLDLIGHEDFGFKFNSTFTEGVRVYASSQNNRLIREWFCKNKTTEDCEKAVETAYATFIADSDAAYWMYGDYLREKTNKDGVSLEKCFSDVREKYPSNNSSYQTDKIISFCEKEVKEFMMDALYSGAPLLIARYLFENLSEELMKHHMEIEVRRRNAKFNAEIKKNWKIK